jgi:hypothetical protein
MAPADVKAIVKNIQSKIEGNPDYSEDVNKSRRLAEKYSNLEKFDNLAYVKASIQNKLIIPVSTKEGKLAKFTNTLFYKVFFVVSKIVRPALSAQESFNRYVLEQLFEINQRSGNTGIKSFPVDEYAIELLKQNPVTNENIMHYKKYFANAGYICLVANNLQDKAKFEGMENKKVFINDRLVDDAQVEAKANFEISNLDEVAYLSSRYNGEFDSLLVMNTLEYMKNYEQVFSFFHQAKRVLKIGADVVIRIEKSKEAAVMMHNPAKKYIEGDILKYILRTLEFDENINIIEEQRHYVFQTTKKK